MHLLHDFPFLILDNANILSDAIKALFSFFLQYTLILYHYCNQFYCINRNIIGCHIFILFSYLVLPLFGSVESFDGILDNSEKFLNMILWDSTVFSD